MMTSFLYTLFLFFMIMLLVMIIASALQHLFFKFIDKFFK